MSSKDLLAREAEFHDRWAESLEVDEVPVLQAFQSPTSMENRFILDLMGKLDGLRILDIGTGLGEAAVFFALRGARVTATDLSPAMVRFVERLASHHGTEVEGVVCPAESLDVESSSFDIVYSANVLHHVEDRHKVFAEMRRALKPEGRFFTFDPLAYNPVINVYRRMATEVRTADETPLRFDILAVAREHFDTVRHREFWLLSLALFAKYFCLDSLHPNDVRYWKRIQHETQRSLWWWRPLAAMDVLLCRIPLVRRLCWNIVVWGERAG